MKTLEKVILGGSLTLSAYAIYTLVIGLFEGVLCYQSRCAHHGNPGENFGGFVFVYVLVAVFGLVSAWRSNKNLKTVCPPKAAK